MTPSALTWFASAIAFALATSATPGPNNAMVTASGATFGFRRTLPHILGISVGFPVMVVAVALGAGKIITTLPWLHQAMRYAGAAYMLWLAWHIAVAEPAVGVETGPDGARSEPLTFLKAAMFQWVNPKAWVIAIGAVVTYTTQGTGFAAQITVLAVMFFAVSVPSTSFWTAVGVGAGRLLKTRRALKIFNSVMAALLVASLFPLLWVD